MSTAAIYCRRSTAVQEASIARQKDECRAYATKHGLEIVEEYQDSASAWKATTPRPGFTAMMADAASGAFEAVVVREVSRLSRQEDDASILAVVWKLRRTGVQVRSVIEPSTGNRLADDISLLLKGHAAKEESDVKSERVQSGKRRGVTLGVHQGAWPCYGYDQGERRASPFSHRMIKFYGVDPAAQKIVAEIFRRYVDQAESPQLIAHELNGRGISPPRGKQSFHPQQRRGGDEWHQSSLRDLISNPLLGGFASYRGRRLKACGCATLDQPSGWNDCAHEWVRSINVPPVIDAETWERAQQIMQIRSRGTLGGRPREPGPGNQTGRGNRLETSDLFLLAGLVWCTHCNERVGCRAHKPDRENGRDKYRCRGRRMGKCVLPPIDRVTLDEAVRDFFVRQFVDSLDVKATLKRERDRLTQMRDEETTIARDELAQVEKELRETEVKQRRAFEDYDRGAMTAEQWSRVDAAYQQRVEHARDAAERLRARVAQIDASVTTADIDEMLDHVNAIRHIVSGKLTGRSTALLQVQLREVFEGFYVSREGDRIIVTPKLRPEWMPEGSWKQLDFADPSATGLEVVEHLEPQFRRVKLTTVPNPFDS